MAKILLDLARSGQISIVFQNFLAGFCPFSYFLGRILAVFQIINLNQDPTTFRQEPSNPIRFSGWSAAGLKIWNSTWSGRLRVGHKPKLDRPVVTPTRNTRLSCFLSSLQLCTSIQVWLSCWNFRKLKDLESGNYSMANNCFHMGPCICSFGTK